MRTAICIAVLFLSTAAYGQDRLESSADLPSNAEHVSWNLDGTRTVNVTPSRLRYADEGGTLTENDSSLTQIGSVYSWPKNFIRAAWDPSTGTLTTALPNGSITTLNPSAVNRSRVVPPFPTRQSPDGRRIWVDLATNVHLSITVSSDRVETDIVVDGPDGLAADKTFQITFSYTRNNTEENTGTFLRWAPPVVVGDLTGMFPINVTDTGSLLTYSLTYNADVWPLTIDPTETIGENTPDPVTVHDSILRDSISPATGSEDKNGGGNLGINCGRFVIGATYDDYSILYTDFESVIGAGATITAMSLFLYHDENDDPFNVHTATTPVSLHRIAAGNDAWWPEGVGNLTVTANTGEPTCDDKEHPSTPWAGSLCLKTSGTDYVASAIGTLSLPTTDHDAYLEIVFNVAQAQALYENNYGLLMRASELTVGKLAHFPSSEGADGERPYFQVTYTPPFAGFFRTHPIAVTERVHPVQPTERVQPNKF